jgi:hypothetical protein
MATTLTKAVLVEQVNTLEDTVKQLRAELEKANQPITPTVVSFDARFKQAMTVGLGCGIPLLSLTLSKISGTLATAHMIALPLFGFALMIAVLAVSLPHLAWAISDITRSGSRASWSLAIALDLFIVLCEFVHVFASDCGLDWLLMAGMATVVIFSMLLNCWAFFKAPHGN